MRRESQYRMFVSLLVGFFLVLVGGIYLAWNSTLSGREFSPELFQQREFRYATIPGTRIRMTATTLDTPSSPCTKYILSHLRSSNQPVEWQVLQATRGNVSEKRGPDILFEYLLFRNADGHSYWDDWSFRNPNLAAILWPIVQQAAMRDLYFCVPELMRTAESVEKPAALQKQLKRICLEAALTRSGEPLESSSSSTSTPWKNWAIEFSRDLDDDLEIKELLSQFE